METLRSDLSEYVITLTLSDLFSPIYWLNKEFVASKATKSAETLKMSHSQEAKSNLEFTNDMELMHYFIVYHVIDW